MMNALRVAVAKVNVTVGREREYELLLGSIALFTKTCRNMFGTRRKKHSPRTVGLM